MTVSKNIIQYEGTKKSMRIMKGYLIAMVKFSQSDSQHHNETVIDSILLNKPQLVSNVLRRIKYRNAGHNPSPSLVTW